MEQDPKTLLLFGDSNTHGTVPLTVLGQPERYPLAQRWSTLLAQKLGATWRVIDEGLPGRTTLHDDPVEGPHKNGAAALLGILESHSPIDTVVVKLGTNDLKPRFCVNAFDIAQSVGKLVRIIRASGCGPARGVPRVIVVCPPQIEERGVLAEMFRGGAAKSVGLSPAMAEMAAREGVDLVDLTGAVTVSPVDGIHYEATQMPRIAELIFAAIQN